MKKITLYLTNWKVISFIWKYLQERQTENWHYYTDDRWTTYHIKKEYLMYVEETPLIIN
jgi:hypothetical protein